MLGMSEDLPLKKDENHALITWPDLPHTQKRDRARLLLDFAMGESSPKNHGKWELLGVGVDSKEPFKLSSCSSKKKIKSCTSEYKEIAESSPKDKCDYKWDYLIRARKQSWSTMFPGARTCQALRLLGCAYVGHAGPPFETAPNHWSQRAYEKNKQKEKNRRIATLKVLQVAENRRWRWMQTSKLQNEWTRLESINAIQSQDGFYRLTSLGQRMMLTLEKDPNDLRY